MTQLQKTRQSQAQRCKCLLCAFADINDNFADWYQATQEEVDALEQEIICNLFPSNV